VDNECEQLLSTQCFVQGLEYQLRVIAMPLKITLQLLL
jgi:hypothetical protein